MRRAHHDVMPDELGLESTLEYCRRNRARVENIERTAHLPKGELTYVFDEVLRTVRYQGVADPLQACYFAHPIRSGFGLPPPPLCHEDKLKIRWDWGSIIAYEVSQGKIPRCSEAITDVVHNIRSQVIKQYASKHDLKYCEPKQQLDALQAVACDAGLAAVVKADFIECLAAVFRFGSAGAAGAALASPANQTYLGFLAFLGAATSASLSLLVRRGKLTDREVTIPGGAVTFLKVFRGLLTWPSESDKQR